MVYQTDSDPTIFDLEEYVGSETFNVSGAHLTNWDKRINSSTNGYLDFQPTHTNEFRFDFDTAVSAFGFNFGANDSKWMLRAFDSNDVLIEELEIGFVAIKPGSYYMKVPGSTGETQRLEITIK